MLTNEQIAEALSRPTAINDLHISLRRQIEEDLLARPTATIQSVFDQHALAARRVSRATFYRYARNLRLIQAAAELSDLLGPDGPSREKLLAGIQNGLLYQLAEAVNAEQVDANQLQKLAQTFKSLVTADIALQKHASQSDAPVRTGRASPGPVSAHQPAAPDASPTAPVRTPSASAGRESSHLLTARDTTPSTNDPNNPKSKIRNPKSRNPNGHSVRAGAVSPGPMSAHQPATPDAPPSTHEPTHPQSQIRDPQFPRIPVSSLSNQMTLALPPATRSLTFQPRSDVRRTIRRARRTGGPRRRA